MSISTKTGDDGTTGLLFNRRVSKSDSRVEAYGSCDELNVAIGFAKASLAANASALFCKELEAIQQNLILLMGEVATLPSDRERYGKKHRFIDASDVENLTQQVHALEAQLPPPKGWAIPGASVPSAAIELARVAARRAERGLDSLGDEIRQTNPHLIAFLNRLSDLLWLMARVLDLQQISKP
jgi:cob(I)alamin adenosyltransferase